MFLTVIGWGWLKVVTSLCLKLSSQALKNGSVAQNITPVALTILTTNLSNLMFQMSLPVACILWPTSGFKNYWSLQVPMKSDWSVRFVLVEWLVFPIGWLGCPLTFWRAAYKQVNQHSFFMIHQYIVMWDSWTQRSCTHLQQAQWWDRQLLHRIVCRECQLCKLIMANL